MQKLVSVINYFNTFTSYLPMHPVHVKNQIFPENQKEQVSIKWQSKNL